MRSELKLRLLASAMAVMMIDGAQGAMAADDATAPTPADGAAAQKQDKRAAEEITVIGQVPVNAAAAAQITATNSVTVLTAQDMERAPDINVAEALGRVPGIAVIDGGYGNTNGVPVDGAARGEGNYTTLRGLDAEYNINQINGVDAAQGKPYSREVQLNLIPPTGLSQIVVNKTSTANMDGDAIGGTIDFRTPTAFDFAEPLHLGVKVGGKLEGRALDYGRDALGGSFSADIADRFGAAKQFGVYASGYYDYRNFTNSILDGAYPAQFNGQWTYARQTASGASLPGLDPSQNLLLTGVNAGVTTGDTERYGGTLSLDWHPDATTTAYLRATYAHEQTEQDSYYSQIYGTNISTVAIGNGVYAPVIGNIQPRYYYETNPEVADLGTFQIGGDKKFGALTVAPNAFFSWGENNEPNHIEISARLPQVAPGFPFGGSSLVTYNGNGEPIAILTPAEITAVSNVAAYGARRGGEVTEEFSNQNKYGGKLDFDYAVNAGPLESVDFGVKYQDSARQHTVRDYTTNKLFTTDANDPSFGSLGLINGSFNAVVPGLYSYSIPTINQKSLFNLFNNYIASQFGSLAGASDQCGSLYVNTYNCDTQRGTEAVSSGYVMATGKIGDVEIIPGLRFEHTDIKNTFWVLPEDGNGNEIPGYFSNSQTIYNKALPSIQVNYRPDDLTVYRGAIWTSYARPAFFQLGGGSQVTQSNGGAAEGGSTTITLGNPNLKAVGSTNFDLSAEWASHSGGTAEVAGFYKSLTHFIYDSINGFTNQTSQGTGNTVYIKPENGGGGRVVGLELSGRQKFQTLPAPFDGFGVGANMTLEHSVAHTGSGGLAPDERLINQPNIAGNLQAFYEKNGFQADISYRHIGDYVSQYGTLCGLSACDTWVHANDRVDLHLGYDIGYGVKTDFGIGNLTGANTYYATVGKSASTIPSFIYSTQVYSLTATYSF